MPEKISLENKSLSPGKPLFRNSFTALVKSRYSCRTFAKREIEKPILNSLTNFIRRGNAAFPNRLRMEIIHKKELKKENFFTVGTYGLIKNANTFIAGILKGNPAPSWENYGYWMEAMLMFATDQGLNSCWIGGVFDRRTFGKVIRIQEDEFIPAIIVLGYRAEKRVLRDKITRWGARADRRKPPEKLFFYKKIKNPLYPQLEPEMKVILENVRLAPSASNKQPWRIFYWPFIGKNPGGKVDHPQGYFHFYLCRDPIYSKILPRVDLQRIDMGIAMFHFEQSAREHKIGFTRILSEPEICGLPGNYEYTVSYAVDI